jgi:ABC-type dipeptide/oligopeptide/nickel transport system permease component
VLARGQFRRSWFVAVTWISVSLAAFVGSLAIMLAFSGNERWWPRLRFLSVLTFEAGGVVAATLALVTLAYLATAPSMTPTIPAAGEVSAVLKASVNTSLLVVCGTLWGTLTGLGIAYYFTRVRLRSTWIGPLAALLWVLPTFLLAIAVQEVQADMYNVTGLSVTGGYAKVSVGQVFWAAVVLGIRPAAYVFRQARVALAEEGGQDYVRAARAKGLPWRVVANRYVLRPALPILAVSSLVSFRLMIGSLPLVEYFFAYPGLGNLFLSSIGLGGAINADEAIAAVAVLAGAFLVLEAAVNVLQQILDPRLREARAGLEAVR